LNLESYAQEVMMQLREIFEYIEKIGFLVFSTIEDGCVHSRVAHFYAWDERGCIADDVH
jgi:hypothetical protein